MDEVKFRNRMAGKIRFPEDMTSKKMVHALLIRSHYAQGILEEIETPEIPEDYYFFKAGDLPGKNFLPLPDGPVPLLAEDEILYPGQPLGLLAGPDFEELIRLSRKIRFSIRRIPPFPPAAIRDPRATAGEKRLEKGDIQRGLNKAEKILEEEFSLEMPEVPSYPRMGIFCYKEGGRYILHLHTQWPSLVRRFCALAANISRKQVELNFNTAGRSWDTHIWQSAIPAALAVATASVIRQPVRLLEDQGETHIPRELKIHYRAGIDPQGKLTALQADFQLDAGAYGCFSSEVLSRICIAAAGCYQCRNISIRGRAYLSNTPPWLPMAGWGLPQGSFGLELLASRLANLSGIDPSSWRKKNLVTKGNLLPTSGQVRQNPPLSEMLDDLCSRSDYIRKQAAGRQIQQNDRQMEIRPKMYSGIGMSIYAQGNEFVTRDKQLTAANVSATLHKEGDLDIRINAVPASPSLMATWRKRISAQLSIPEEQINFIMDLPDEQTFTGPSTLSRSSTILTRLIDQCCDAIQKKRFREALPITETGTYRRRTKADWNQDEMNGSPFAFPSWSAAVVEVELETATMELKVPRIWLALDCGYILDAASARSFIEAEVRMALCQCLRKQAIRPSIFPELIIDFIDHENSSRRIGGLEGLILGTVAPAFAQAVSLASGLQVSSLPLNPGDLLKGGSIADVN